ncbi:MAG: isoaspartyl peptidase/L-asparaginase [Prevotellaceae bacterium]|jgi:beta-aspartyl-peptidase (threonine type)|nr:isoaspartyl peptidase/L-asparaginase [Prevotellaceae bacterium]
MNKSLFNLSLIIGLMISLPIQAQEVTWSIALHGGAGGVSANLTPERIAEYELHLTEALNIGKEILNNGGRSLDAVESVVRYLEDCPLFNAGKGAVLTADGKHELDAAIMDGSNLMAGAIAGVTDIKNPISTARMVMEKTPHLLLIGTGASAFAKENGAEIVENEYFSTPARLEQSIRIRVQQEQASPIGTVGCVALDTFGNLSAATSTGGMGGKMWGRVGDVPIIGAGTYANNQTMAISGTGHGELWIRQVLGFQVHALMLYKGLSLQEAADEVIFDKIAPMGGSGGGIVCVDKEGNVALVFNTGMMHRAWAKSNGEWGVGVIE